MKSIKISNQEKKSVVKKEIANFGDFFSNKLNELKKQTPCRINDLKDIPGIYVFYLDGKAIYVGRTDKIKSRIQMHTRPSSGRDSATFAFILAKEEFGNFTMKRKELEEDKGFKQIFEKMKMKLSECEFRFLEVENDLLQAVLEPYLAYELETYPYPNTFENH